jgi:anaerobic selenocysteine-containing dehydrogenase
VIPVIQDLSTEQKNELLNLLSPRRTRRGLTDEEATKEITAHLRRVLGLSDKVDLVQGFRRRMIETTIEFHGDQSPTDYDLRSDRNIAEELLRKVAEAAASLSDMTGKANVDFDEFAKGFKTMSQADRADWLYSAALAASQAKTEAETGADDEETAREAERLKTSHDEMAARLLEDVAAAGLLTTAAEYGAAAAATQVAKPAVARAVGFRTQGAARALSTLAGPIGVVAGGVFLYRLRKARQAGETAQVRGEARKERLSPVFQAVVTTSAYLLAHASGPPEGGPLTETASG